MILCILQVRATNLNELVYKNGQAGISKATVTITFDNSDVRSSPIGYESQKTISVTRIVSTRNFKYISLILWGVIFVVLLLYLTK